MNNYPSERFQNQDECDDLLAELIEKHLIDENLIIEDEYFKYNDNLKKLLSD